MARDTKVYLDVRMEDEVSGVFESIQESAKETADVLKDYFGEGSDVFNSVLKGLSAQEETIRRIKKMFWSKEYKRTLDFEEYEQKLINAYKAGRLSLNDMQILRERAKNQKIEVSSNPERDGYFPSEAIEQGLDEYYGRVKFADSRYFSYRKSIINEDAEYLKKMLKEKFDEEAYRVEMSKQLLSEYYSWMRKNVPQFDKMMNLDYDGHDKKVNLPKEKQKYVPKNFRDSIVRNELGEVNRLNKEYLDSFTDAVAQSFNIMRVRMAEDASEIEQIWGNMINRMLGALQGLVAEWLVFNSIAAIFGMGSFGSVSFESLLGIPKLAGGGDFVVPPGFPNDSYPILVQSGERVRVTPAGSTGSEARLLGEIRDALYAINLNRSGRGADSVQVKLYVDGREVVKATEPARKKMQREGRGLVR